MKLITDITAGAILSGWFGLDDRRVTGTLLVNGHETSLHLRDDAFFHIDETVHRDLRGTLQDLTKVTLIDCVIRSSLGSTTRYDQTYHTAEVTPHFIVSGHRHLEPAEARIARLSFRIDDAEAIFNDFDAFGTSFDPKELIASVVEVNERQMRRKIPVGPNPEIAFFRRAHGNRDGRDRYRNGACTASTLLAPVRVP